MTLFEKGTSENGHVGNRSLQDKEYAFKRGEYKKSNFYITRKIAEKNKKWNVNLINERTEKISTFIDKSINKVFEIEEYESDIDSDSKSESDSDSNSDSDSESDSDSDSEDEKPKKKNKRKWLCWINLLWFFQCVTVRWIDS